MGKLTYSVYNIREKFSLENVTNTLTLLNPPESQRSQSSIYIDNTSFNYSGSIFITNTREFTAKYHRC